MQEHESSQSSAKADATTKRRERAERDNNILSAQKPTAAVSAVVHNDSITRCIGCFGKTTERQAPCGCRYCPDCLAGIFLQALEEEIFSQPQCCGRLLPMDLAAPILERAGLGIHANMPHTKEKGRNNTKDSIRTVSKGGGKAAAVRSPKAGTRANHMVDCLICMESFGAKDIIKTPCQHYYCHDCMKRLFLEATKNESLYPPQCCNMDIPLTVANAVLNAQQQMEFTNKGVEFLTKDRLYCSSRNCSAFIQSKQIYHDVGTCGKCWQRTCVFCKGAYHPGHCPKDKITHAVLHLAQRSGWRKCFNCEFMVAMDEGCNHVTCKYVIGH